MPIAKPRLKELPRNRVIAWRIRGRERGSLKPTMDGGRGGNNRTENTDFRRRGRVKGGAGGGNNGTENTEGLREGLYDHRTTKASEKVGGTVA